MHIIQDKFFSLALTGSLERGEGQGRSALCNSSCPELSHLGFPEFIKIAFDVCKDNHLFLFDTYRGHGYQNSQWLANVEDDWLPLPIIFPHFFSARAYALAKVDGGKGVPPFAIPRF